MTDDAPPAEPPESSAHGARALYERAVSAGFEPEDEGPDYRELPHEIEAEQAVLGALLVYNDVYHRLSEFLRAEHFYEPLHGRLYDAISTLIGRGQTASPITLGPYFAKDETLSEVGGNEYLARLMAFATTSANAIDYGHVVHDLALRRGLIEIGEELSHEAFEANIDVAPASLVEEAEKRLFDLAETGRAQGGFEIFREPLERARAMAEAAFSRDGGLSGIATGLRDIDALLGGLQPSDLMILAGRPGMGKTALACNIAFNIAKNAGPEASGGKVAFYSLEMSSEQLALRLLAEESGIPSSDIRRGEIGEDQYRQMVDAMQRINEIPLYIDDSGGLSIAALAARARRQKRQTGLDLVIVDYLQLVTPSSSKRFDNRVAEISEVTQALKALAKELNVPVIALSQLSRKVEERADRRPQLSDLRESGSIEQDADVVLFVFREEYYTKMEEPNVSDAARYEQWAQDLERVHGLAEVIVGKQRHGPTGVVSLQFDDAITRFSDLARGDHLPERRD